ncbi:MAG: hypothetical protein V1755_12435 [Chloroflexota bacterium]
MVLLLAAALVIGFVTLPDYGESWDEADIRSYSAYAVDAYAFLLHPGDLPEFETNLNLYGPGYFAAAGVLARLISQISPSWSTITAWHAVYFFTFLTGVLALYLLALRWMGELAAFGAALLFITQPLLWGHAFINPKDIPFLTFFLATVLLGLRMVDGLGGPTWVRADLLLAAVLLGFTSSLRVLGPLAGLIVLVYAGYRRRAAAIRPVSIYLMLAAITTYLCWPYLWAAPVSRFIESFNTMAEFPFNSAILFAGALYKAGQLPITYFPTMLGIQLTETAILLIAAGLVVSMIAFINGEKRGPLLLPLAWFLVPTLVILGSGSPLYDNARQLYFLLPPLFVAAGLALEHVFRRIRQPLIQGAILLAAALPGILIGARLHPYEYVYYNAVVGGTGGAFRRYEMDYWGTSFDELSERMNAVAARGSRVLVYGPEQIVAARARPDLQVFIPREDVNSGYDYVVLLTRSNADLRLCREAETIYSVGRRGAIFSELRSIPAGTKCQ